MVGSVEDWLKASADYHRPPKRPLAYAATEKCAIPLSWTIVIPNRMRQELRESPRRVAPRLGVLGEIRAIPTLICDHETLRGWRVVKGSNHDLVE